MVVRDILAAAAVGACIAGGVASAADLPSRAPPPVFVPPPPVFTWTGFYVGGYAGGSFAGNVKLTSPRVGALSFKRNGFAGGGLAGYNYQIGSVVLGVDGDAGYDGEKASSSFRFSPGRAAPAFRINVREKSDGFVGRVRGRVGFATGNFFFGDALIYAAGGGSYLREQFTFTVPGAGSVSTSQDRMGFNVGGGVEIAFTPHWIARAEYIYDDFGTKNYPALGPFRIPFKASLTDNTARGAIIYKF